MVKTVCELCGNRGFSVALIYCDECQTAAVHRYCLNVLPETLEEYVIWYCVDCEAKVAKLSAVGNLNPLSSRKYDSRNLEIAQATQSGLRLKKKKDVNRLKKNKPRRRDPMGLLVKSVIGQGENSPCHHLDVQCSENHKKDQKFRRQRKLNRSSPDEEAESVKTKTSVIAIGDCKNDLEKGFDLHCSEGDKNSEKHGRQIELDERSSDEEIELVKFKTSSIVNKDPTDIPEYNCYDQRQTIIEVHCKKNDTRDNKSRRWQVFVIDSSDEEIESVEPKTSLVAASDSLNIPTHSSNAQAGPNTEVLGNPNDEKASKTGRQKGLECGSSDEEAESAKHETSFVVATVSSNNTNSCVYAPAQPIFNPIWNGSLHLSNEKYGTVGGVVAHLSTMACARVFEEAKLLPEVLCPELLPRSSVWPKHFQKWGPSDDSIGLYLFPNNESDEKVYDGLVDDMISHDLAMRAVLKNAELLLFPSNLLPFQFWRFQSKFYLWGVFRGKQGIEAKHYVHALSWYSQSPVSPLSRSGSYCSGSAYSPLSPSVK